MRLKYLVKTAGSGIMGNLLRALLTALGILIGVASVIMTLALGNGARAAVDASFRFLGSNQIKINSQLDFKNGELKETGKKLTYKEVLDLSDEVPEIKDVEMEVNKTVKARHGRAVVDLGLSGTTASAINTLVSNAALQPVGWSSKQPLATSDFIDSGRFYNATDVQQNMDICVLAYQTALDLFPGENPLDQTIWINRKPYSVIGVLVEMESSDPKQRAYTKPNEGIYIPVSSAIRQFFEEEPSVEATVTIDRLEHMDQAKQKVLAFLREKHDIMPDAENIFKDDFSLTTKADLLGAQQEAARTFSVLLTAMAIVSLTVGGIGIMNVMLVSVTERTREIGIRLAVGARKQDIVFQFMLESVLLSAASGIAGIILGILSIPLAAMFNQGIALLAPESIPLAFSVSLFTGVVFGLYPAIRAARLDPIEALRYE